MMNNEVIWINQSRYRILTDLQLTATLFTHLALTDLQYFLTDL